MSVYIFLAPGFEEIEAIAPIDIFRRADLEVVTVSITNKKEVCGAHGITIVADKLFDETDFSKTDLLFLPGGMPGTMNLEAHAGLKELLTRQYAHGKCIAAICAAPSILGNMGMLQSKEAICYPGFEKYLKEAKLSSDKMVKSDNIFTAIGVGVAIPFALMIVEELKGKKDALNISSAICL